MLQTDREFIKVKQMMKNPNVALFAGNYQIQGKAVIKNHPFNNENKEFLELYKKHHFGSYEKNSKIESNIVIEIQAG